jgi:DUF1680 family protein
VEIEQKTEYPWDGAVRLQVRPARPLAFALALRLPGWCNRAKVHVNGKAVRGAVRKGYLFLNRTWKKGDTVTLELAMPAERVAAQPRVHVNAGRVALQRGPVVYCLEEADNGENLDDLVLSDSAPLRVRMDKKVLGGVPVITAPATRSDPAQWRGKLYQASRSRSRKATLRAVPYAFWANRAPGEMIVWVRRNPSGKR